MIKLYRLLAALSVLILSFSASAQATAVDEKSQDNFMVVVRESMGANRLDDSFTPTGKLKAKLSNGTEIELEMASWEFIGGFPVPNPPCSSISGHLK